MFLDEKKRSQRRPFRDFRRLFAYITSVKSAKTNGTLRHI